MDRDGKLDRPRPDPWAGDREEPIDECSLFAVAMLRRVSTRMSTSLAGLSPPRAADPIQRMGDSLQNLQRREAPPASKHATADCTLRANDRAGW